MVGAWPPRSCWERPVFRWVPASPPHASHCVDQAMKAATLAAGGDQTEQTRVFDVVRGAPWPAIYPGRALRNTFSAHWNGQEEALAADQPAQEKAWLATAADDFATRVVWAGEGVDLIDDMPAASEIIERVIAQAVETLTQGAQLVCGSAARSI